MRPRARTDRLFSHLPILETDRLILRPVCPEDADDFFAFASDPLVTRYITWTTHRSREETSQFIVRQFLDRYARNEPAPWGIEHKGDRKLIGTCGFSYHAPEHARAEIVYTLARPYWGRGYMPEAVRAAIAFGFQTMGLNRIEAGCLVENVASARVMAKVGLRFEAVLREYLLIKGVYYDIKQHALLRRDWPGETEG